MSKTKTLPAETLPAKKRTANEEMTLRDRIMEVAREMKARAWELAALLYEAKDEDLFKSWGFEEWHDYVEEEVGLGRRAVNQLIANYATYRVKLGVSTEKLEAIEWTKARDMIKVVDADNVEDWIERAGDMSRRKLIEEVRKYKDKLAGEDQNESPAPRKFRSFSFDPEQDSTIQSAIDRAMRDLDTDSPSWAIDAICQSFLQEVGDSTYTLERALRGLSRAHKVSILALKDSAKEETKLTQISAFVHQIGETLKKSTPIVVIVDKDADADSIGDAFLAIAEEIIERINRAKSEDSEDEKKES